MPNPQQHRLMMVVLVVAVAFSAAMAAGLAVAGWLMGPVTVQTAESGPRGTPPPVAGEESPSVQGPSLRGAVVRAARKTTEQSSSRLRMTVRVTGPAVPYTVTVWGTWNGRRGEGQMHLDVPGVGGPMRQVITPDALYVRTADTGGAPRAWVQVDRGNFLAAGGSVTAADPVVVADSLLAVSDGVALDGTAQLRGRRTIVYVGVTDLRAAAHRVAPRERRMLKTMLPGLRNESVPFTAFVDKQGRLVRLVETVSMVTPQLGPVVARVRLEFFDYGVPVRVNVPGPGHLTEEVTPPRPEKR